MKAFVPNFRQIGFLLISALLIFFAVIMFLDLPAEPVGDGRVENETLDNIVIGILFALIGAGGGFAALFLLPCGFVFCPESVTIYYLFFLRKEYGEWKKLRRITLEKEYFHGSIFPRRYYQLHGLEGDRLFFMEGEIDKNIFTKYFITKYWDGTIVPKKKKRNKAVPNLSANLAVQAEREVRREVRAILSAREPELERAKLHSRAEYYYDSDEDNSRPLFDYSYCCNVILSNEAEEEFYIPAELLRVMLKRNVYVPELLPLTELTAELDRAVARIREVGLEKFVEEEFPEE